MAKNVEIVSDGTPSSTKVYVDGEVMGYVTHIEYRIDAKDKHGYAQITVLDPKVRLVAVMMEDESLVRSVER